MAEREFDPTINTPATALHMAIAAAEHGEMPPFTQDGLLETLHLDGEEPDGRTIIDRLVGDERNSTTLRPIRPLNTAATGLIDLANRYETNDAQEAIARAIGGVLTKQITREGDICPGAKRLTLACTRDDIVSPEVRASLEVPSWRPLGELTDDELMDAIAQLFTAREVGEPGGRVWIWVPRDLRET
jgi:hypothetical protein